MNKYGYGVVLLTFLFFGVSFSSAFIEFFISPNSSSFTLSSLESSSSNLTVTFNNLSATPDEGSDHPYRIERNTPCNQYNENYDCIDTPPDLCPYLSLEPNNTDEDEIGFQLNASSPGVVATGFLISLEDEADDWTLTVTSPCFENECPVDYNPAINGVPLPQSLKGQTFKCNLATIWNGEFQSRGLTKTAYADITNEMTVEAVLTGETEQHIDPVIIIPGIMGSAYKNHELVIDPILHIYDDLIATLDENGYTSGVDLFTFPYEWRDSNVLSANLLKNKIDEIKDICNCSKVDLVAHSMGGLVAREYIQSGQYVHDVDQVIFLGTPHRGSPQAYLRWEAGEFEAGTINTIIKLRFSIEAVQHFYFSLFNYIQGRPVLSVQELLPVFDYLKDKNTGIVRPYSIDYPRNIFLEALNTNTGISNLLNSGVRITNIVGNIGATSTIERVRVVAGSNPLWINGKPDGFDNKNSDQGLEYGPGDTTVTITGATLDSSIPNLISQSEHIQLPSAEENNVFHIITNKDSSTNIHRSLIRKMLTIQLHSPIDMVIVAPDGKKIGKNFSNGQEYNEIPDAFYSGYNNNDDEYITIPNPLDGEYKIQLQGTGSGQYTVDASYISEAVATTTAVTGSTIPGQINNLTVELDNNAPGDLSTDPDLVADINKSFDVGWIKDKKIRDQLLNKANAIIKFEKKIETVPDGKNKQRKIERLNKKIDRKAASTLLLDLKGYKRDKITLEGYNLLKGDLEWIINH